ncbi:hypothetical protein HPB47_024536 [Ixodes persulcatus]|uniref:Uncharacterized protein n=1 Tax=Ixodes persulcatus TaxID=34615 RepID=A0AC60Q576_IXOPE|nr:hypothetical protein HPB47_024536 [Ixodes persulcatus]
MCAVTLEVCGFMVSAVSNLYLFMALRFIVSFAMAGILVINYILLLEQVAAKSRGLYGTIAMSCFGIGLLGLYGFKYLHMNWQTVQIVIMLPTSVLLMSFTGLRWLAPASGEHKGRGAISCSGVDAGGPAPSLGLGHVAVGSVPVGLGGDSDETPRSFEDVWVPADAITGRC